MRSMTRALWIALAITGACIATPLQAAGNYSQNFSTTPTNWSGNSPYTVQSGYYKNTDHSPQNAISVYDGDTWNTNYTLNVRLYSQYGGSPSAWNNQVGIVFNYQDEDNHYRVLFNTVGTIDLERVTNGVVTSVSGGHTDTITGMDDDIWVDAQLVLSGNQVTVRVKPGANWQTAFSNVTLTGLTTAKIGVVSRFNLARFDDLSVTPSANLLFKTGFDGAVIQPPRDCAGPIGTCWQDITGTDPVTNFTWPANVWTLWGRFQTISVHPVTPQTLPNYISNEIRQVTGPNGNQTAVLYQGILQPRPAGAAYYMQDPYILTQATNPNAPQGELYIRYWLKMQSTPGTSGLGSWRTVLQWKTGGDFRIDLAPATFSKMANPNCPTSTRFWRLLADNEANSTDPEWVSTNYWEVCDTTGRAVPTGEWMKLEMYWRRGTPGGTDGRVWVAINGQQLFNEVGRRMWGDQNKPINRIMAPQLYTSAQAAPGAPVEQFVDDYEVWDSFPPDASPH